MFTGVPERAVLLFGRVQALCVLTPLSTAPVPLPPPAPLSVSVWFRACAAKRSGRIVCNHVAGQSPCIVSDATFKVTFVFKNQPPQPHGCIPLDPCCLLSASTTTVLKPVWLKAFMTANLVSPPSHTVTLQCPARFVEFCLDITATSVSFSSCLFCHCRLLFS